MAIQRTFKGDSLLIAVDNYVVVDLETTGVSPARDRIIEIGAVRVEGGNVTAEYSRLVNPGRPVGSFITNLTGISDEMVRTASPIDDVLFHRYAAVEPCAVPTGASASAGGPDPTLRHRRRGGTSRPERCLADGGML